MAATSSAVLYSVEAPSERAAFARTLSVRGKQSNSVSNRGDQTQRKPFSSLMHSRATSRIVATTAGVTCEPTSLQITRTECLSKTNHVKKSNKHESTSKQDSNKTRCESYLLAIMPVRAMNMEDLTPASLWLRMLLTNSVTFEADPFRAEQRQSRAE